MLCCVVLQSVFRGGLIQFTSAGSNSLIFQAFDGDFVDNAGYKLLKSILMDTVYIENISPNLLDNLAPNEKIQLTLKKCDNFGMEIVIKHNGLFHYVKYEFKASCFNFLLLHYCFTAK